MRKVRMATLAALFAGGALFGTSCTSADIYHNLIQGSLAYVKGTATSFWGEFVPTDEIWEGLFNDVPKLEL